MRPLHFSAVIVMLLMPWSIPAQENPQPSAGGRQGGGAQSEEAAARYAAADVRILTVGIIYNAGLVDLAAAFTKETGKKVAVNTIIMGSAVNAIKTANPPADVIMLPFELMSSLALDGNIVPGTYLPLGRSEMGLAVRAGAPHPDISTVEKLAAALRPPSLPSLSSRSGFPGRIFIHRRQSNSMHTTMWYIFRWESRPTMLRSSGGNRPEPDSSRLLPAPRS